MRDNRVENSLLMSLNELRDIEKQRVADERAAEERKRQAAIDAARAAEQAKLDAEEARKRAEREEIMRIQLAQVELERQARMRLEAAEAAERARLQAELDAQRAAAEIELRREEVARKRPTWMLVVTGVAFVAAVGLGIFAYGRARDTARAEERTRAAQLQQEQAKRDAEESQRGLDKLQADSDARKQRMDELEKQLQGKIDAAKAAEIQKKLEKEHADQVAADKRAEELRKKKEWEIRHAKIDVSNCVGQAVCKETGSH